MAMLLLTNVVRQIRQTPEVIVDVVGRAIEVRPSGQPANLISRAYWYYMVSFKTYK